jgi:hypothetical protein
LPLAEAKFSESLTNGIARVDRSRQFFELTRSINNRPVRFPVECYRCITGISDHAPCRTRPFAELVGGESCKSLCKSYDNHTVLVRIPLVRLFLSCHIFIMIRRMSRYILIVLLAFTFGGGTFAQAESAVVSGVQCEAMMQLGHCSPAQTLHVAGAVDHQKTPMKPMSPGCIDQMACIGMPMLSAQLTADVHTVGYSKTIYSLSNSSSEGLSPRPTVFPPICLTE